MFMPGVWFLWSKKRKRKKFLFQKENGNTFTLLIIVLDKSLQKEQIAQITQYDRPLICRNKPAINPKWFNSLDTNSIRKPNGHYRVALSVLFNYFPKRVHFVWSHSQEDKSCSSNSKKRIFCLVTFLKEHIIKRANSNKDTFQKGHILNNQI